VTNDLQAPALCPNTPPFSCIGLVRFIDREVILARAADALTLSNVQEGTFATQSGFALPDGTFYVEKRGWLSVDARKGDDTLRFITTHLLPEGFFDPIQVAQGQEVVAGPAQTSLPVIFVCDCNSRADNTGTATYANLLAAGLDDAWLERHPHQAGLTCCQDEDLRNEASHFDQRIDLVLVRGGAHVHHVGRTGESEHDKTASGLWPSDHAGVVATVDFRP